MAGGLNIPDKYNPLPRVNVAVLEVTLTILV